MVIKSNNPRRVFTFSGDKLLLQIFNLLITNLNPKLDNCFENIEKHLFELAEKSESNIKQAHYFDSMRLIRESKQAIAEEFTVGLKLVFESFSKDKVHDFDSEINQSSDNTSFSLIDNEKLDESLAKVNLINKSETAYHKHIYAFVKRFSSYANNPKLDSKKIPIGPFVLVHCFEECINTDVFEVDVKLMLFQFFERTVMGQLNDVFILINEVFIDQGIVPEIKYNIYKKERASSPSINQESSNQNTSVSENPKLPQMQQGIHFQTPLNYNQTEGDNFPSLQNLDRNYQLISQFLTINRQLTRNSKTNNSLAGNEANTNNAINHASAVNIDLKLVIEAITILQNNLFCQIQRERQTTHLPAEIKNNLIRQLHKIDSQTKKQQVKQIDEDTIDLVTLVFKFIVDDRNLPKTIQIILAKLQLPYLKVALQDRNLFADKNHEARILLDKMALASVGWTEASDINNQFINKIEEITHHILEIEDYNNQIFEMLQINFDTFLAKLKKKSDVTLKRTTERAIGEEKIKFAKQQTARLFLDKMENKNIPILIQNLLLEEWSSILILLHLRFPQLSKEFLEAVTFVENLVEYSQVNSNYNQDQQAVNYLVKIYEKGLKLVVFQKDEFNDKKQLLKSCLNGNSPKEYSKHIEKNTHYSNNLFNVKNLKSADNDIINLMQEMIEPPIHENITQIDVKYFSMVDSLKVGNWVMFHQDEKELIRAKLSWISPVSGDFLFVNSRGYKIIEKTSLELAKGFEDKSIQILLQIALFDRALSSIVSNLNDNKNRLNLSAT